MSLNVLIDEYPGDSAWEDFVGTFPQLSVATPLKLADKRVERVLLATMGSEASGWLDGPVPALDGQAPHDVLANHPKGEIAVRSLLMRMP